jgi:hypothetical protein
MTSGQGMASCRGDRREKFRRASRAARDARREIDIEAVAVAGLISLGRFLELDGGTRRGQVVEMPKANAKFQCRKIPPSVPRNV